MNWNIVGHERAVELIQMQLTKGEFPHAFLIVGPKSVGRFTLAKRMAQFLNCERADQTGEPCLNCLSCQKIERISHPDLWMLEPGGSGAAIKVDQIRELLHFVSLAPYEGKYRIVILREFEFATNSASNALLKTLEEPPSNVVIILTCRSTESLLPTITSRCEVIRLRPVSLIKVSKWLETEWNLDPDGAANLAHICGGNPGLAVRMIQNPAVLKQRSKWIEEHTKLLSSTILDKFLYLSPIFKESESKETKEMLKDFLSTWISIWRDVILVSNGDSRTITNRDYYELLKELSSKFGSINALRTVKSIERTVVLIDRNVNTRLAMETLMLDLPRGAV